jgi:hypothetical protein
MAKLERRHVPAATAIKDRRLVERIEERLRAGERLEELAARAGVSHSTLYWTRRTGMMSARTAEKLRSALGREQRA